MFTQKIEKQGCGRKALAEKPSTVFTCEAWRIMQRSPLEQISKPDATRN